MHAYASGTPGRDAGSAAAPMSNPQGQGRLSLPSGGINTHGHGRACRRIDPAGPSSKPRSGCERSMACRRRRRRAGRGCGVASATDSRAWAACTQACDGSCGLHGERSPLSIQAR
eukprot:352249-Chlamydomonas_euryale.AAC.3